MADYKIKATRNYLSPVTASLDLVGSNKLFNYNTWKQSIKDGYLDLYVDTLMKSNSLNLNDFYEKYNIPFGNPNTIFPALLNELNKDTTPIKTGELLGLEKPKKSLEQQAKERDMKAKGLEIPIDPYDVETTKYDYTVQEISKGNTEYAKQMLQEYANQLRVNQQGFDTCLNDILGFSGSLIGGIYTGISKIAGGVGSLFMAMDKDNGKLDDNYFDRLLYSYNKVVDTVRIDSVADAFAQWEYNYTHLYDENGNQNWFPSIVKSATTSIGEMIPSMLIGQGIGSLVGKVAGAIGGTASGITKAAKIGTKISYNVLFYGSNVFMADAGEQYKYFNEQGMSVPTGQIYAKAGIKAGLQLGIEWALGKVFGSTGLDQFKGMNDKGMFTKAMSKVNNPTGRAILNFVGDAIQEGAEESFQETTDFLTDALFHYWNNNFESKDWSWQSIWDAAVAGAISSLLGGSARIIGTERVSVGRIKTNKNSELVFDKNGKPVYQTMNKLASYQYGLDMQSFVENYQSVINAGEKLSKLDDGSGKYDKAMLQYKTAYTQAVIAQQLMTDYYGAVGRERFEKANEVLKSITQSMNEGKFDKSTVEENRKALALDLKELFEGYSNEQINKALSRVNATKVDSVVTKSVETTTSEDKNVVEKSKKILDATDAEKIVITEDGNTPIKLGKYIIVPKKFLLNTDEAIATAALSETVMVDKLIEEIEKRTSYKQGAIDVIIEIYAQWSHQDVSEITPEEAMVGLIYNPGLFQAVLITNEKLSSDFVLTLNSMIRDIVNDDKLFDRIFKTKIDECIERWTDAALDYYANNLNEDTSKFTQGLDVKKRNDFNSKLKARLQLFNLGKQIILNPDNVSNEVWEFIEKRIDNANIEISNSENADNIRERLKRQIRDKNAQVRVNALNEISQYYNYAFTTLYNGEIYMPMTTIENHLFNSWLQSLGLNISNMFDVNSLTVEERNIIGENPTTSEIFDYRKNQFDKFTDGNIEIGLDEQFHLMLTSVIENNGYIEGQKLLFEQLSKTTVNKKVPVELHQTVGWLKTLLRPNYVESFGNTISVNDIILNQSLIEESVKEIIRNEYGVLTPLTVYRYIQNELANETDGKYTVLIKGDGTFVVAEMVNLDTIFVSDVKLPNEGEYALSKFLKPQYQNSLISTATVRFGCDESCYVSYETKSVDGKRVTVPVNRIEIADFTRQKNDKVISATQNIRRIALGHEITHINQMMWKLNCGNFHNVLSLFGTGAKNRIISDVKKLHPELFVGSNSEKSDAKIVNDYLYYGSGESVAYGLGHKMSFYPVRVQQLNGDVIITLDNGKSYTVPKQINPTFGKRNILSSLLKVIPNKYGNNYVDKQTDSVILANMNKATNDLFAELRNKKNLTRDDYIELMYQSSRTSKSKEEFEKSNIICIKVGNDIYAISTEEDLSLLISKIYNSLPIDDYKVQITIGTIKPKDVKSYELWNVNDSFGTIEIDNSYIKNKNTITVDFNETAEIITNQSMIDELYGEFFFGNIDENFGDAIWDFLYVRNKAEPISKNYSTSFEIGLDLYSQGFSEDFVDVVTKEYIGTRVGIPLDSTVKDKMLYELRHNRRAKYQNLQRLKSDLSLEHLTDEEFMNLQIPVIRYQRGNYDLVNDKFVSCYICTDPNDFNEIVRSFEIDYHEYEDIGTKNSRSISFYGGRIFFGTITPKDINLYLSNIGNEVLINTNAFADNSKYIELEVPDGDIWRFGPGEHTVAKLSDPINWTFYSKYTRIDESVKKDTVIKFAPVETIYFKYDDGDVIMTEDGKPLSQTRYRELPLSKEDYTTGVITLDALYELWTLTRPDTMEDSWYSLGEKIFNKVREIKNYLNKNGYRYESVIEIVDNSKLIGAAGYFSTRNNSIQYKQESLIFQDELILHELLHAITSNLVKNSNVRNEHLERLRMLYNYLNKDVEILKKDLYFSNTSDNLSSLKSQYGMTNLHEFMSELVDEYFKYGLKHVKFLPIHLESYFINHNGSKEYVYLDIDGRADLYEIALNELNALIDTVDLKDYLVSNYDGHHYSINSKMSMATVPKPNDHQYNGPIYQDGELITENAMLEDVCDMNNPSDRKLLIQIARKLGINVDGKNVNDVLFEIFSEENINNGLTVNFVKELLNSEQHYDSLYVGGAFGTFFLYNGKIGRFTAEPRYENEINKNVTDVNTEDTKENVPLTDVKETVKKDKKHARTSVGKFDGFEPDPNRYDRTRTRSKKNVSIVRTITDPDEMSTYTSLYERGGDYVHRRLIAVEEYLGKKNELEYNPIWEYYYEKHQDDYRFRRYVLSDEIKNTSLKYFKKPGKQLQMNPKLRRFIIAAEDVKIAEELRDKISGDEKGTLTWRDLIMYIVKTDAKDVDFNTFTLIRDIMYEDSPIKDAYELQELTNNISIAVAVYLMLRDDDIPEMVELLNRNITADGLLSLHQFFSDNKEYAKTYNNLLTAYNKKVPMRHFSDIKELAGEYETLDISQDVIKYRLLRDWNGQLSQLSYIGVSTRNLVIHSENEKRLSIFDTDSKGMSTSRQVGTDWWGETIGEVGNLMSDDDALRELKNFIESIISTREREDLIDVILDVDGPMIGPKLTYQLLSKKIITNKLDLSDTFFEMIDQEAFNNFAEIYKNSKNENRLQVYFDFINSLDDDTVIKLFSVIQSITARTSESEYYKDEYEKVLSKLQTEDISSDLQGNELDEEIIVKGIKKVIPDNEKVVRNCLNVVKTIVKNISTPVTIIDKSTGESRISKLAKIKRFVKEYPNLFKIVDNKLEFKKEVLYEIVDGKSVTKSVDELLPILKELKEMSILSRSTTFDTDSTLVAYKRDQRNREKRVNEIVKKLTKVYKSDKYVSISLNGNAVNVDVKSQQDIPQKLRKMMSNGIFNDVDSKVQEINTYHEEENEDGKIVKIYDQQHKAMYLKDFIDKNEQILLTMSEDEAIEIIEFLLNYTGRVSREEVPFIAVQEIILAYFLGQSREIDVNGKYDLSEEMVKRIENKLEDMASFFGAGLSYWKTALKKLKVSDQIKQSMKLTFDITLDEEDEANLESILAYEELNRDAMTNEQIVLFTNEYNRRLRLFEETLAKKYKGNKKKFLEQLMQWERAMMLSSPGTWLRNQTSDIIVKYGNKLSDLTGNKIYDIIVKVFPKAGRNLDDNTFQYRLNKKPDKEITSFLNKRIIENGFLKTCLEGVSKYNIDRLSYKTAADNISMMIAKTIGSRITRQNQYTGYGKVSDVANKLSNLIYKAMSDDPYVIDRTKELLGKILQEDYDRAVQTAKKLNNKIPTIDEWLSYKNDNIHGIGNNVIIALTKAADMAAFDYMHTSNVVTFIEKTMRDNMSDTGWFIYKQVFPFAAASWNWFVEGMRYTPVGLAKAVVDLCKLEHSIDVAYKKHQKGLSTMHSEFTKYTRIRNLGKGAIGTVLLGIGILLSVFGLGEVDDDDDEVKLNIAGVKITLKDVLGSTSLTAGISFTNAFKNKEGFINAISDVFDEIFKDSLFTEIMDIGNFEDNRLSNIVEELPMDIATMFYPNLIKSIVKIGRQRRVEYSAGFKGRLQKLFVSWIPVPAEWLGAQISLNPYTGKAESIFNADNVLGAFSTYLPVKLEYPEISDIQFEAIRQGVKKKALRGNYEVNDVEITVSNNDRLLLNEFYGNLNSKDLNDLMNNKVKVKVKNDTGTYDKLYYSKMTDKQKKAAIENIMSNNSSLAKIYILTNTGECKYYASDSEYAELKKLGVTKNVYRKTNKLSGFVKIS